MPSKQELLSSIQPGMKLKKNFFMRIYGYELTWPGFAEQALTELEGAGCSKAREYYQRFVSKYEQEHDEMIKEVAKWYRKQTGEREVRKCRESLKKMSNNELLTFLENLVKED